MNANSLTTAPRKLARKVPEYLVPISMALSLVSCASLDSRYDGATAAHKWGESQCIRWHDMNGEVQTAAVTDLGRDRCFYVPDYGGRVLRGEATKPLRLPALFQRCGIAAHCPEWVHAGDFPRTQGIITHGCLVYAVEKAKQNREWKIASVRLQRAGHALVTDAAGRVVYDPRF